MSIKCLNNKNNIFNKVRLGRLICSFILFAGLLSVTSSLEAQTVNTPVASDSISITLADIDGDSLNDVTYENKSVKVIISSKTGAPSLYYLKGGNFNENMFPPQITDLGYNIEADYLKPFEFDNVIGYFSQHSYNIEIESENENQVVIRATANTPITVDENVPDCNAVSLVKRYTFNKEGYDFKLENTITNLREKLITVGDDLRGSFNLTYGPGIFMDPFGPNTLIGLKANNDNEFFTKAESLNDKGLKDGVFTGIGVKDSYFCVLMESDQPLHIAAIASSTVNADERKKALAVNQIKCGFSKFNLGAKESRSFSFQVYAGPFIYEELSKINRTKIADFGFLNTILLKTLRFFYSLFPNYGVAIILMTLLIRLILYPLTLKQTRSMAEMQKLQPKLKDIQDRYRDDRQKMNEEVMKLYAKHKVNPLGGCLPLLLQLPIIMALYNTLRIAVELRKAPFLWMSDLSKGDPYLILPIAITALQFYQQGKSNIDPQQKQAMAFMPMMMFVIMWSLPSGLLVYWFASSVLGLLQQLQANHIMDSIKEE